MAAIIVAQRGRRGSRSGCYRDTLVRSARAEARNEPNSPAVKIHPSPSTFLDELTQTKSGKSRPAGCSISAAGIKLEPTKAPERYLTSKLFPPA